MSPVPASGSDLNTPELKQSKQDHRFSNNNFPFSHFTHFDKDNNSLRKNKINTVAKKNRRYASFEFGTLNPKPPNQIMSLDTESKQFSSGTAGKILNPQKRADRIKLSNLRMKLDALKNMCKRTGNYSPYTLYKELPGRCVNLFTCENISIKPRKFVVIKLKPEHKGQLSDKVWMAHPYKNRAKNIDFQNHMGLHVISTIIDKTVEFHESVCIQNISNRPINIKNGTLICQAKELHYSVLPQMDNQLIQEIDSFTQESELSENKSPRKEAEEKFEAALTSYDDPEVKQLILDNKDLFLPSHDYLLDKISIPPIKLGTKSEIIVPTPPPARRHFTEKHDEAISTFLEIGLMNGLIQRQQSDTVSPLHAVEQNGKIRIVMDSRKVNEQLSLYNYIFPRISEEIVELASSKFTVFSQTDLTSAFNQIEIHPESRSLLAFGVYTKKYRGVFAYNRLPFGIKSAPSIFASVLDRILENINDGANGRYLVKSFIDDIAIGAIDKTAMFEALRKLFARLGLFNVKLSLPKSDFFTKFITFCGIEVNQHGYCISEKRKKILMEYPDFDVTCKKKNHDLRHLGFYNWHRRFVKNYSQLDREIRDTIKRYKNKELSSTEANSKIKKITDSIKKEILKSMLITPNGNDIVTMQCDASGKAWGYVLFCDRGVISYGGGSFTETVIRSHNIFEKETAGMSHSLADCYKLLSQAGKLIIKNDNLSLITVNKTNKFLITPRIIKYLSNIVVISQQLPSQFVHLNTLENYLADVLSRLEYRDDGTLEVNAIETNLNKYDNSVYRYNDDKNPCTKYFYDEVFPISTVQLETAAKSDEELLQLYKNIHSNFHWSYEKSLKSLKMYGLPIKDDLIKRSVLECQYCNKLQRVAPLSKLKFRENPEFPFSEIHVDHIIKKGPNKSSFGHTAGFTIKCALTRFFFCYPVNDVKTRTVVNELQNCFMATCRIPKKIYADNAFDSMTMREFCKRHNIDLAFRAANLSRSVSVESTHRRLHEKINSLLGSKEPSKWHEVAWKASIAINCQHNESTGFTPYYLFYGKHPPSLPGTDIPVLTKFDHQWRIDLKIAKMNADLKRRSQSSDYKYKHFRPDDNVLIRPDNSKNARSMSAQVIEDKGGATMQVKLSDRARPISVHKGMVFIEKFSDTWYRMNPEIKNRYRQKSIDPRSKEISEPVAKRTRSRHQTDANSTNSKPNDV